MDHSEKFGDGVRAVDRALAVLHAFSTQDHEMSAVELAKRVNLSRPTLYRLLYTLEKQGFIVSVGEPQRFRLGPAIPKLAHVWTSTLDLPQVAQPVLRRVWEATGETVALFVPQGGQRLCVAEIPCPQPLSFKRGIGYSELIALGASGRAILAFTDAGEDELAAHAARAGLDRNAYLAELRQVRERGYAISQNELIHGAAALAVPFFDRHQKVAGSIGVFGPAVRLDFSKIEAFGRLVKDEASALSRALGAAAPVAAPLDDETAVV